jgi:hypothetical protein
LLPPFSPTKSKRFSSRSTGSPSAPEEAEEDDPGRKVAEGVLREVEARHQGRWERSKLGMLRLREQEED